MRVAVRFCGLAVLGGGHGYRHANRALGNPRFIGLPILSAKVGMAFVSVAKCPAF